MIEKEWEPIEHDYIWSLVFHSGKRLLLRPQRAGRLRRETFGSIGVSWWSEGEDTPSYLTRAQAAQAENERH